MKKKIILALVIMAIFSCLFAIGASAVVVDGLDYTFTVSTKYEGYDGTAELNTGNKTTASGDIVIPESVTSDGKTYLVIKIANTAFQNNKNITSVTIPASITTFGQNAFSGATNLAKTNYLGTVAQWCAIGTADNWSTNSPTIVSKNFYINDELVVDLIIPEGVKTINQNIFRGCLTFESVSFPSTLTTCSTNAFADCKNIKTVTYAGTLEEWCEKVTCGNSSANPVVYSGDLKTSDYQNGMPANLVLPESVTKINAYTLAGCKNLVTVEMTDKVTSVGNGAFYNCVNLISIRLTDSIKSIPELLFSGCTKLATFNFPVAITSIGKESFKNCKSLPAIINIPSTVKNIYANAFDSCTSIKYVKFPAALTDIGGSAFAYCTGLQFMDFSESTKLTKFTAFGVFIGCTSLKAASLPDSLATISERAFNGCTSLQAVYLPSGLTSLATNYDGQGTFSGCTSLYFVSQPFSVSTEYIDNDKFVQPAKPDVYFMPEGLVSFGSKTGEQDIFQNCYAINKVIVFSENFNVMQLGGTFDGIGKYEPKSIVFRADMTTFKYSDNQQNITYYFVNSADKGLSDISIEIRASKDTVENAKMVFCHGNVYANLVNSKKESTETEVALDPKDTSWHVKAVAVIKENATCTTPEITTFSCLCEVVIGDEKTAEALGHDKDKELSYDVWVWENDNYFDNAKYKHTCQVCGVEYLSEEYIENSYLFIKEGFATFENKDGEAIKSYDFQYSIKVNTDAMDNYTVATGKVIKYGTVAGVGDSVANPISYENGTLTVGASAAVSDMTGTNYVKLLIKVTGVPVIENGVEITCNAYAIVDDKLRYIGDGNVGEVAFTSVIK